jgi:AcrR family transcriptional regulator
MAVLSPESYFKVALDLLAQGGPKLVTIANLCDRLHVTTGSFYYHFTGRSDFMRRLLLFWEHEYAQRLVREALDVRDPTARIDVLIEMSVNLHHDAESAIRAYARSDQFASEVLRRVDGSRRRVTVQTFVEAGFTKAEAELYATMSLSLLIGMQQVSTPVNSRTREAILTAHRDQLAAALATSRAERKSA